MDWASKNLMSAESRVGAPVDLACSCREAAPFNVLHVCKRRNLLLEFADYPVQAFSYDAADPTNRPPNRRSPACPRVDGWLSQEDALQQPAADRVLRVSQPSRDHEGRRYWWGLMFIPPATPAANFRPRARGDATTLTND